MTISDEQLSAFLDAELPEDDMELVRQGLMADENLANRLAELALVDEQIAHHYAQIDQRPMPAAITALLAPAPDTTRHNVIEFPRWKSVQQGLQQHAAIAACTLLVIGFGMVQLLPGNNNQSANNSPAIAQILEQNPSGSEQPLADGSRIKPRLTFIDNHGNYCRQYQILQRDQRSDNIACRHNNSWELVFSLPQENLAEGDYQTASGNSPLDNKLDEIMRGEAFDANAEQAAIHSHWAH